MLKRFIMLVVIVSSAIGFLFAEEKKAETIKWAENYEKAVAEAKETGKIIMIDFYADWCGWCKKLDKETYTDSAVIEMLAKFVSLKINTDEEQTLAKKYNVTGLPAILFVDSNGDEVERISGFKPADDFLSELQRINKGENTFLVLKKKVEAEPDNLALKFELAEAYYKKGDVSNVKLICVEIIEKDKENKTEKLPDALFLLGLLTGQENEFDKSIEYFEKIIIGYPDHRIAPESLFYIAIAKYSKSDIKGALDTLNKFIEKYPEHNLLEQATMAVKALALELKEMEERAKETDIFDDNE